MPGACWPQKAVGFESKSVGLRGSLFACNRNFNFEAEEIWLPDRLVAIETFPILI